MMLKGIAKLGYFAVAALVLPALPLAAASNSATSVKAAGDLKTEATNLLKGIRQDAGDIVDHAEALERFALDPTLSWQAHASQLEDVRYEVNDMGAKLSRLETISPSVTRLQKRALETALPLARQMAANTTEAIQFVSNHEGNLWLPAYRKTTGNLYGASVKLDKAVKEYLKYAKVRAQEAQLGADLGLRPRS